MASCSQCIPVFAALAVERTLLAELVTWILSECERQRVKAPDEVRMSGKREICFM
jgi:hypothetical protein